MLTDIEIATAADLDPIAEVASDLSIPAEALYNYGPHIAKISLDYLESLPERPDSKLVLVTAMSPTPAGEGKTTTSVGLVDGLKQRGRKALACLREPSMGPVFGMKGGAAGGGYAQVVPMADLNLHFTGDIAAIGAAHNLLSALIDNHIHHGNELDIDPTAITWPRVIDMNDRALRSTVVALGGKTNGLPRQDSTDITVASEVMAVFCLATDLADLKERLGRMVVAFNRKGEPVTASDLGAVGAMTALLVRALEPNLVQTLEHTPAIIHGGPFANIAHGCSSVIASRAGLKLADIVVTEAGFGADLGAEKFVDLVSRATGIAPSATVIVATVRALKYHGGIAVPDLNNENLEALEHGIVNLRKHIENVRDVWGLTPIVALNIFPSDTDAEVAKVQELLAELGVACVPARHFAQGGEGALELADEVAKALDASAEATVNYTYADTESLEDKVRAVATKIYGAADVSFELKARKALRRLTELGYGELPVCIAKTQYSFSTDKGKLGAPSGHTLAVRDARLSAGAGFVVILAGAVMTMPGLPRKPAALGIDVDQHGNITGLF